MHDNEVKKISNIMRQNFFGQKTINEHNSSMISQNNISKAELFNINSIHKKEIEKKIKKQKKYARYQGFLNGIILILAFLIKFLLTFIYIIKKGNIIIFFQYIFFSITMIMSTICIFSSPGILPMNINNKQKKNFKNSNIIYKFRKKYYVLQGRLFKLKVCSTCLITRPLGSTHCKRCNVCIEKIDHHCPWVGNCIGINNYKFFYYLLCSYNIFTIIDIITDVEFLISNSNYKNKKTRKIICIIFLAFNSAVLLFIVALLISHTIYVWYGETTYMRIKMKHLLILFGNPFNKGPKENFKRLFCQKYKPKKIKNYMYIKFNTQFNNFYLGKSHLELISNSSNIIINSKNRIQPQKLESQITKKNSSQNVNINYYINNTINNSKANSYNSRQKNVFGIYKNYEEDKLKPRNYYHTAEIKKNNDKETLNTKSIKTHYTFKLPPRKYLSNVSSCNSYPSSNSQSGNVFFVDHAHNTIK